MTVIVAISADDASRIALGFFFLHAAAVGALALYFLTPPEAQ